MQQPPHEATDSDSDLDHIHNPHRYTTLLLALINHPQRHTNARIRSLANQIIHQQTYTDQLIHHPSSNSYTLIIPNQLIHDNPRTLINIATDAINRHRIAAALDRERTAIRLRDPTYTLQSYHYHIQEPRPAPPNTYITWTTHADAYYVTDGLQPNEPLPRHYEHTLDTHHASSYTNEVHTATAAWALPIIHSPLLDIRRRQYFRQRWIDVTLRLRQLHLNRRYYYPTTSEHYYHQRPLALWAALYRRIIIYNYHNTTMRSTMRTLHTPMLTTTGPP